MNIRKVIYNLTEWINETFATKTDVSGEVENRNLAITAAINDLKNGVDGQPTTPVISKTYTELYALTQSNGLTIGQHYLISDYQTVHEIPNTSIPTWDGDNNVFVWSDSAIHTADVEPLLVTALSTSKLANECYSTLFPQDIIYYDIESNQTMVKGCTKGYIYRRIDTLLNNDIDLDFRNVRFRIYKENTTTDKKVAYWITDPFGYGDGSIYFGYKFNINYDSQVFNSYVECDVNTFEDVQMFRNATDYKTESIYNNKFCGNTSNLVINRSSVFFGNSFNANIVGDSFSNNTIGDSFYNNNVDDSFNSNTVGINCINNTIGNSFSSNTIGDSFYNNNVGSNFNSNTIGNSFSNNTIGSGSVYNTIGNYFYNNTIGSGSVYNTIGNNCINNTIGNSFYNNNVGSYFNQNTVGNNLNYNDGVDFTSSTYVYLGFAKELFTNSEGIPLLKYYDETNTLIILPANQ